MSSLLDLCLDAITKNAIFPNKNQLPTELDQKLAIYRRENNQHILYKSTNQVHVAIYSRDSTICDQNYRIYPSIKDDEFYRYILPRNFIDVLWEVNNRDRLLSIWVGNTLIRKTMTWDEPIFLLGLAYHHLALSSKLPYLDICCGFYSLGTLLRLRERFERKATRNYFYNRGFLENGNYLKFELMPLKRLIGSYDEKKEYNSEIAARIIYKTWFEDHKPTKWRNPKSLKSLKSSNRKVVQNRKR
jgi:hypothetical protein